LPTLTQGKARDLFKFAEGQQLQAHKMVLWRHWRIFTVSDDEVVLEWVKRLHSWSRETVGEVQIASCYFGCFESIPFRFASIEMERTPVIRDSAN